MSGDLLRIKEMLLVTAASRSKDMMADHLMPEEVGSTMRLRSTGKFIFTSLRKDLRDEGIGMLGAEVFLSLMKRIDHVIVIEPFGKELMFRFCCQ